MPCAILSFGFVDLHERCSLIPRDKGARTDSILAFDYASQCGTVKGVLCLDIGNALFHNARMAHLKSPSSEATRTRGRPRQFDIEVALGKAARVFRERGYHASSIADLTQAMELASGSVYKAFRDKRSVFVAAFDHEARVRAERFRRIMAATTSGRDRIRVALIFSAEASYGAEGRRGCLIVGTVAGLSTFDADIAKRATAALHRSETLMADLIRQGQADGSIHAGIESEVTARLMLCVLQGMRVIGKTGRTRAEMLAVANAAMKFLD
ncbi:Transcriptional regulator, TetR family [Caballeronia glathei]|jgi:AcrR family transcriptional regulator|nr:Transcriptional regulator, TetR family [Caballeronia glathei]